MTEWGLGSGKVRQLITAGRAEACWGVGAGPQAGTHRQAGGRVFTAPAGKVPVPQVSQVI